MFSLLSEKISGVLSLALQGITTALGVLTKTVITVVDEVVSTVSDLTAPLSAQLGALPVVGDLLSTVLNVSTGLVSGVSAGVHAISDQWIAGDLACGVNTALNGTTDLLGQGLGGVSDILDSVLAATAPLTAPLANLPILGDVVTAIGQTGSNLSGLVDETGQYVAAINPLELINNTLENPVASVGGVIQDVSGTLDALLNDLVPVTDVATSLPVAGAVVGLVGETVSTVNQGLYELGAQLGQVNSLDHLSQTYSYV